MDPERGAQPLFNESGEVAVAFNGEIYNHGQLRHRLQAQGHRFRSRHADGEVIAHLYETMGADFPRALAGQFAIALWDARQQTLWLMRDHAGIKPLYYAATANGGLIFASEPKALLTHPQVSRGLDWRALHGYFSFKNIPAPQSAWAQIRQLRPGQRLCWRGGRITLDCWTPPPPTEDPTITQQEAAQRIRTLLEQSVRQQMQADAPVAAALSGGVDSAAVVALMSRMSAQPVATFTLTYDEAFPNKRADQTFARQIAERVGANHHEVRMGWRDVADSLEAVAEAFDEPFSGVTSAYFLNRRIADSAKAVLTGDGADELFGSYRPHRLAQPLARLATTPESARDVALWAELAELDATPPEALTALLRRGGEAARRMGMYLADDAGIRALYTPRMQALTDGASNQALVAEALSAIASEDPLNRMLLLDRGALLPDQVLAFVDRLSMAHGLEARPPFLDAELMRYADTLPGALKIQRGRVKHILKEALRDLLPEPLLNRPKEGFILPINHWLRGPLAPLATQTLRPERLARHGLLRAEPVAALLQAHLSGRANHGDRLWNLLTFQLWWERCGEAAA
ncbi:putative asparagine synthase [Magnetofaba australis IT-1]|uniref:asparagine synthase (glutamine-hydrolyzing) n=1 Tax=Magnetofaba australis IT-1 TaxID=1434232 RepID=A0A1Y2K477_9PROT|nr:putative asparagine synthase [Magnetofaba australis IT-1]